MMSSRAPYAVAYRILLAAYPRSYREAVGREAEVAFSDLHADAARVGGDAVARLWLRTVPRVLGGGLAERIALLRMDVVTSVTGESGPDETPPYGWAAAAAGAVFVLYAATLAPTTAYWDASEYIATAHILGVPHPPGNPLFVVLGRAWDVLLAPFGFSVAVRINLFSAFMSAGAHGLWFLTIHHVLGPFSRGRAVRLVGAAASVWVSATAFTVWNQSNVNEKVYTISLLTIALLSWLAIRWQTSAGRSGRHRLLVLMAFILALSVGNHLMAFLAAPALLLFIALVEPRALWSWRVYPWLALAGVAGLSIHLFLPIRAALQPIINEGAPLCDSVGSALQSVLTYGRAGCEALGAALTREQYQKPPVWVRQAPITEQLANYLQYFDWQWARGVQGTQLLFADLRIPFTALFTGLGVWGAVEHHRRSRETFWYMAALFATLSLALVVYMNFFYGYSMPGTGTGFVEREVRERDYFFIVSFSIWGLWAGVGITAAWWWVAERLTGGQLVPAAPVLALAAVPFVLNVAWADRSDDFAARDWAHNLLESVEPYGVLFTVGDNDTFPLWYLQEVEGVRRDVTVVVTSYLNTAWYAKQVRDVSRPCATPGQADANPTVIVCQREYRPGPRVMYASPPEGTDSVGVVPELRLAPELDGRVRIPLDAKSVRPELPIMELDDTTIDEIARSFVRLPDDVRVDLGELKPVIAAGTIIEPWHQYALAIVDTAFSDDRPVYWAANAGPPASLGLDPYLVRQGVAFKLQRGSDSTAEPRMPTDTSPTRAELRVADPAASRIVALPPDMASAGRWVDATRTRILLDEVFLHRGGLPNWSHWPDRATGYTPAQYAWANLALAQVAYQDGDSRALEHYEARAMDWMALAQ